MMKSNKSYYFYDFPKINLNEKPIGLIPINDINKFQNFLPIKIDLNIEDINNEESFLTSNFDNSDLEYLKNRSKIITNNILILKNEFKTLSNRSSEFKKREYCAKNKCKDLINRIQKLIESKDCSNDLIEIQNKILSIQSKIENIKCNFNTIIPLNHFENRINKIKNKLNE